MNSRWAQTCRAAAYSPDYCSHIIHFSQQVGHMRQGHNLGLVRQQLLQVIDGGGERRAVLDLPKLD